MKHQLVLHVVAKLLIPYLLLFAFYVQFHGELSPGGGFQAGVIFAAAFILYSLVFGFKKASQVVSQRALAIVASLGVLVYGGTGAICLLLGRNFLDYYALPVGSLQAGQQWGIMAVEMGVGMTVFSVMLLLFYLFTDREEG